MTPLKQMARILDFESFLQCFFGLNSEDLKIYYAIANGCERIEEISRLVGKKGNAVYKSLQRLLISGLVYREKKVIDRGGYYFIYKATPREIVATEVEVVLRELCEKVRILMRDFLNKSSEVQELRLC
ncbi:MAG: helix-turn-helix domain-containing protein [Archaeoglobaceae archaeon]|nr:helix-turn-helix domain-containing protein [Archaeoglobaceae archaeon]